MEWEEDRDHVNTEPLTGKQALLYDGHAVHYLRLPVTLSLTATKINMHDNKDEAYELRTPVSETGDDTKPSHGIKSGTARDAADMMRLGKKQEFRRNFHAFSMLGLSSVLYVQVCARPWHELMLIQLKYGNMAGIDRVCNF